MQIAVDFDGTLTRGDMLGGPPVLREGAASGLRALAAAGHTLILHSVRFTSDPFGDDPTGEKSRTWTREAEVFLRREKLWCLFAEVWTRPGKPYADVYLDDRAVRIGDGTAGSTSWANVAEWYGIASGDPKRKWDGQGERPRLVLWRSFPEVRVWIVDGAMVRGSKEYRGAVKGPNGAREDFDAVDFTEGGNGGRYPWIPEDEVWIDSGLSSDEIPFVALHELVERYWMLGMGKGYEVAHEIANRVEKRYRADPRGVIMAVETASGQLHLKEPGIMAEQ